MLGTSRILVLSILFVVMLVPAAYADNVDRLIKQLESEKEYKIRLSAAANLGKLGDQRGVEPLIAALADDDKNVRAVAATSLGRLVTAETSAELRQRASDTLARVASKDAAKLVRDQAKRALATIRKLEDAGPAPAKGGIYIDIGAMSDKSSSEGSKMRELMRKTVEKTLAKNAASMVTSWPGGKPPSAKQLQASATKAFHIDGTLVSLDMQAKGSTTLVSCKVSMLIATYPKKSMFGFLDGAAKVQADSSPRSVQYAQEDCVTAVIEDLVARKIIPTIQTRSE